MLRKRPLFSRVYLIAEGFGIDKVAVNRIINTYIEVCREDILQGYEVRISGLVSIVPNVRKSEYSKTVALYAMTVSNRVGYAYQTCLAVIKEYFESCKEDLQDGMSVDLRTIVTLHPLFVNGELSTVRAAISTSIKHDLALLDSDVTSARAHTCKLLKYAIATSSSESEVMV